ncbi:hypothetical protein [Pararhizobium sp. PWRC1-1]|uniref:hypothetical protein n=1 Tax=Pararhizobium sp. PWRC1-1 TaxID=2804566 RepID=UPI003CF4C7B9
MAKPKTEAGNNVDASDGKALPMCGIVMPIAAMDGYDETHWVNVNSILDEAVQDAGFTPQMVSTGADIGVIQARIVQNLYDNPIIICDVSGKNANVMFELGLRLAFDKPVIIVKDDATGYSFDTSPIEHLTYRRDLRYQNVLEFKEKLTARINATIAKSQTDQNYSPFLRHFGKFEVAKLETNEINSGDYIIRRLDELQSEIRLLALSNNRVFIGSRSNQELDAIVDNVLSHYHVSSGGSAHPLNSEEDVMIRVHDAVQSSKNLAGNVTKAMVANAVRRAMDRFIEPDAFPKSTKNRPTD